MVAIVEWHRSKAMRYRGIVFAGVLSAAALSTALDRAQAQGIFDFLFGGYQQQPSPQHAERRPSVVRGAERARQGAIGSGRAVAFCVRLCDGRQFPLERMANATPVETCHAMCPSSETKVFFGSEIGHAVAADGQRYTNLDTAFSYRKEFVAHCTCDGKDAFGLVPLDVKDDPTLRSGDIISTRDGFVTYSAKRDQTTFTPVDPSTVTAQLPPGSLRVRLSRRTQAASSGDDLTGTIVSSPDAANPSLMSELRGQLVR
jgi:Protein of unknown function (DUF2865)